MYTSSLFVTRPLRLYASTTTTALLTLANTLNFLPSTQKNSHAVSLSFTASSLFPPTSPVSLSSPHIHNRFGTRPTKLLLRALTSFFITSSHIPRGLTAFYCCASWNTFKKTKKKNSVRISNEEKPNPFNTSCDKSSSKKLEIEDTCSRYFYSKMSAMQKLSCTSDEVRSGHSYHYIHF